MNRTPLYEYINPSAAGVVLESEDHQNGKNLYMKGIFIEGGVRNANQRVYPVSEIANAVKTLQQQITVHGGVLGELDHPNDLKINLDRVSHMIVSMWMEGDKGCGKLKILPTPMGNLVKTMLEAGVKLGVSSRGSGNVNEGSGHVSDFEIITVDVVAQPSAPNAYPKAIYESLANMRGGHKLWGLAQESVHNPNVQKYLKTEIVRLIQDLKI
jgi:Prohead core protein serine protease